FHVSSKVSIWHNACSSIGRPRRLDEVDSERAREPGDWNHCESGSRDEGIMRKQLGTLIFVGAMGLGAVAANGRTIEDPGRVEPAATAAGARRSISCHRVRAARQVGTE